MQNKFYIITFTNVHVVASLNINPVQPSEKEAPSTCPYVQEYQDVQTFRDQDVT